MRIFRLASSLGRRFIAPFLSRHDLARGLSLFLGGFAALNLAADALHPGFDANLWWIDVRWMPAFFTKPLLFVFAIALLLHAFSAPMPRRKRKVIAGIVAGAAAVAMGNAFVFWRLLAIGSVTSGAPAPLSFFIAAGLAMIAWDLLRQRDASQSPGMAVPGLGVGETTAITLVSRACRAGRVLSIAACFAVAFALSQMVCFGKTDYARRADAAIVFGARVYADGRMSDALADRVRTGCDLYHRGLVSRLIFSGGPGDAAISEPQAMRAFALQAGVPAEAVILDERGISTQATVDETRRIMRDAGVDRALAVSHFYHLPRIKLAYQRSGLEVYTVPAKESYTLTAMPMYLTREAAAWWWYYVRPLAG